jgi:hypothetical protein
VRNGTISSVFDCAVKSWMTGTMISTHRHSFFLLSPPLLLIFIIVVDDDDSDDVFVVKVSGVNVRLWH